VTTVDDLTGSWRLTCWDHSIDGSHRGFPLGEDAEGQIIYAPDGNMSAILMQARREPFGAAQFHQGTAEQREVAALTYISYGGTYELDGDRVVHHLDFALFPDWIGTDLIRVVSWEGDQLVLTTLPETTTSGKTVVNRLIWRRVADGS
jgi:hypothetical protein